MAGDGVASRVGFLQWGSQIFPSRREQSAAGNISKSLGKSFQSSDKESQFLRYFIASSNVSFLTRFRELGSRTRLRFRHDLLYVALSPLNGNGRLMNYFLTMACARNGKRATAGVSVFNERYCVSFSVN